MQKYQNPYFPGIIFFFFSVLISLFAFKDYGMSFDEMAQREMGIVSYDYITGENKDLESYVEKDHGVGFEVPLIFIERTLGLTDTKDIYEMRHLVAHWFFLCCCFCGYILSFRLFKSRLLASIGFLLLAFHPHIYAHSYFNSKDIPFLATFLVSLMVFQIAFEKDKKSLYLLAGIVAGYTTSIRILGIVLIPIASFFFIFDIVAAFKYKKAGSSVVSFVILLTGFCFTLYATFPTLWKQPLVSFVQVFESMSYFSRWNNYVLFAGQSVIASELPWYYLPLCFCVNTPIVWVVLGFTGIVFVGVNFVKAPLTFFANTRNRNFLLYVVTFIFPVLTIIVLHSIVYDGWRHVFFIYPSFVLLILYAMDHLRRGKAKFVIYPAIIAQFGALAYFMVHYHPFQQNYFNELVPKKQQYIRKNYEMDYWGASLKQGLKHIVANDPSPLIKVYPNIENFVVKHAALLPKEQRSRIQEVYSIEDADYFISNFRWHPEDYPYKEVFYEVKVSNSTIMRVYKLK